MKVCPDCGYKIDFGSAKFCHNCGNYLAKINTSSTDEHTHEKMSTSTSSNALFQHIVNKKLNNNAEDEKEEDEVKGPSSSIYDLGVNLEEVVEQILKKEIFLQKDVSSLEVEVTH